MNKYIDTDKLKALLEARIEAGLDGYGGNLKRLLEDINSLQQEMWKPSEKQMEALSDAYAEASTFKMGDILESLYDDLKKLL